MKQSGKRKRGEGNNSEPEDDDGSSEKGRSRSCGGERALRKPSKRRRKEVRLLAKGAKMDKGIEVRSTDVRGGVANYKQKPVSSSRGAKWKQ